MYIEYIDIYIYVYYCLDRYIYPTLLWGGGGKTATLHLQIYVHIVIFNKIIQSQTDFPQSSCTLLVKAKGGGKGLVLGMYVGVVGWW